MLRSFLFPAALLAAWSFLASCASALTVKGTILVFARSQNESYSATAGLNAHGIPYELVIVPQAGITLPTLNSSDSAANYGGIVTLSELSYDFGNDTWHSALTDVQMNQLYAYQAKFGVRMVRLDVYPDADFGVQMPI